MKAAKWTWTLRVVAGTLVAVGVASIVVVRYYSDESTLQGSERWLQRHRMAAASLIDGAPIERDVARWLGTVARTSRVVGVGEPTHGSAEFFVTRQNIIEELVEDHGFSVIALEAPVPDCRSVNRFVLDGVGSPESAIQERMSFWTWRNQELADLIAWAREFNLRSKSGPALEFLCFDFQPTPKALEQVIDVLADHHPEAATAARQALSPLLATAEDQNHGLSKLSEPGLVTLRAALGELESDLASFADERDMRLYASTLRRNIDLVAGAGASARELSHRRDSLMFELLTAQLGDDRKAIVLAHNMHISKHESGHFGRPALGGHLVEKFGRTYHAIAQLLVEGETRTRVGATLRDSALTVVPIPPVANALGASVLGSESCAVVNLREAPRLSRARRYFGRSHPARSIGAFVPASEDGEILLGFNRYAPLTCFDALIVVRHVTPSAPIESVPDPEIRPDGASSDHATR